MSYPMLEIDLEKLQKNTREVVARCGAVGAQVAGVVKGFSGLPEPARQLALGGCTQLASSRISQLEGLRQAGITTPLLLVRVPMLSELDRLVEAAEYSLQSDWSTLDALEAACARRGRTHSVLIMAELGDLREGIWDREALRALCLHVEQALPHVRLAGIGTNLGCYGAVRCTPEKLEELSALAALVEGDLGRPLELVSGGATNAYVLVERGLLPPRINHLRVGGGMILGRDMARNYGLPFPYLAMDAFTFKAQVVEVERKPSCPVGELSVNCFSEVVRFEDRGVRARALIAAGKADYCACEKILPRLPGAAVLGASSDHTILDVEDCRVPVRVGDVLEFDLCYPAMLFLTAGRDVEIRYMQGGQALDIAPSI